jgi:hypothetical protein
MNTLVIIGLVVAAWYTLACLFFPYAVCGSCQGGKKRSASGRSFRRCGRCGGSGSKLRFGSRLLGRG